MLSIKEYRAVDHREFDLTKFVKTAKSMKLVDFMFCVENSRILYCPSQSWTKAAMPEHYGTMMVTVEGTKFTQCQKFYGKVFDDLFNAGIVQVDTDIPTPNSNTVIFRLSDAVLINRREGYRRLILQNIHLVTHSSVGRIAAIYGVKVIYDKRAKFFRVCNLDDSKICINDYVTKPDAKGIALPITHIQQMTLIEWDDVFFRFHQIRKKSRETRERRRISQRKKTN